MNLGQSVLNLRLAPKWIWDKLRLKEHWCWSLKVGVIDYDWMIDATIHMSFMWRIHATKAPDKTWTTEMYVLPRCKQLVLAYYDSPFSKLLIMFARTGVILKFLHAFFNISVWTKHLTGIWRSLTPTNSKDTPCKAHFYLLLFQNAKVTSVRCKTEISGDGTSSTCYARHQVAWRAK